MRLRIDQWLVGLGLAGGACAAHCQDMPLRTLELPPSQGNPRNSEGAFVTLKDGRVMMFIRTGGGCQYLAYSSDGGETWSAPADSDIRSPLSPASIKRLPSTGDLLLVWNDHSNIPEGLRNRRVPLSTAISQDDGKTWRPAKVLEGNPQGWYCYIAIHPTDDAVLLGYCAMSNLAHSRVTRVPLAWLFEVSPVADPTRVGTEAPVATRGAFND